MTRRRLPHIYPKNKWVFFTWNLHGCVPQSMVPPPGPLSSGEAFVCLDRRLDNLRYGPMYLRRPEVAQIVADGISKGVELGHYDLGAYVIMPNHVHLLLRSKVSPDRLMKALKGSTARECNRLLGRTGEPFWQKESYDHWFRNDSEFARIRRYIKNNPVKAGLVASPDEYVWSTPCVETSLDAARTSACATCN